MNMDSELLNEIIEDTMPDVEDFYILGLPIRTEIGNCHFITIKDYPNCFIDLQTVALTSDHIINKYSELNKDGSLNEFIKELRKVNLFEIAMSIPELTEAYSRLFNKVFQKNEVFFQINNENSFNYYRQLIMKMNGVKEEEINPNPEIQRAIERSKRVKARESGKLEFSDIVTSVVGYKGLTYADIRKFTVYQLYMTFYRIAQFKNYDTSTLFATVSADKVNIESWSHHIDLFKEEKHFVTEDEFKQGTGSVFEE